MQVYLLTTTECNLKCSYCIRGNQKKEYIDLKILKNILDKNDFTRDQVLITGGEPTLHPGFEKIVRICCEKFKNVSVNTNGMSINKIEALSDKRIHIQISLDGSEIIHEKIRGENTYRHLIENIRKIDKIGFGYNIATVVNSINKDDIINMIPALTNLKNMRYWKVEAQLPFGCGNNNKCITVTEWNALVEELLVQCPFRLVIKKIFDFSLLKNLTNEQIREIGDMKVKNCGNCKEKVYIYPDMTVYPCTCLIDFPIGNLCKHTIQEILESSQAKIFSDYKVKKDSQCYNCKYLPICNGGCIGMSYNVFGKLGYGDIRCKYVKKI